MTSLVEKILWGKPSPYLFEDQLDHFLGGSADSRHARLRRAVQNGHLVHVRRGLYVLGERLSSKRPHLFELAEFIYGLSYISLESALSYHGLIPEAVHVITSMTTKRKKEFDTPLGKFVYNHLPVENFFLEVDRVNENGHTFFIASPWKALFDYLHCYQKKWISIEPVGESLRIDLETMPRISEKMLALFKTVYHSKSIHQFINNIPKKLINEY